MTVSHKKSKGGFGAGSYYIDSQKSVDDYYTAEREPPGTWHVGTDQYGTRSFSIVPKSGTKFGPEGDGANTFAKLINGFDPETGNPLVRNAGSENRVAFHDFTTSSPKSVSVIWSLASQDLKAQIQSAQAKSSERFLDHMSVFSYCRYGAGGISVEKTPLMAAMFEHGNSRENDPQLHTHCVIFNLAQSKNGNIYALETWGMMCQQGVAASLYHANLAWEMAQLGFDIEKKNNLFEIKGVPEDVMKHFSRRRQQIVDAVEKRLSDMGIANPSEINASRQMFQIAALESRDGKDEISREDLLAIWKERGKALGFSEAQVQALMHQHERFSLTDEDLQKLVREVISKIEKTESVYTKELIQIRSLTSSYGLADPGRVMAAVEAVVAQDLIHTPIAKSLQEQIHHRMFYTSQAILANEKRVLRITLVQTSAHVLGIDPVTLHQSLKDEQREAIRVVMQDKSLVSLVDGAAGAGKTFTMQHLADAYRSAGYQVTDLAASWKAATDLGTEATPDASRAVTCSLNNLAKGKIVLHSKSLLILDEAGMTGMRDMARLLEAVEKAGAKIILLSDTQQQRAVAGGDPVRMLAQQNGSAKLRNIPHQKDPEQLNATYNFFKGKSLEGLAVYKNQGNVQIRNGKGATQCALIEKWIQDRRDPTKPTDDREDQIILAVTKEDVAGLNRKAHEALKDAGLIDEEKSLVLDSVDDREPVEFCVGDQVQLRMNSKLDSWAKNRVQAEVIGIDGEKIHLNINAGDGRHNLVIDTQTDEWKREGKLALSHAYVLTPYSSRNLTANRAYIMDDVNLDRAAAGVTMSRHRYNAHVFIDREARYAAKMKASATDDWRPISKYSDLECLGSVANGWARLSEKSNATDFETWENSQGMRIKADLVAGLESAQERALEANVMAKELLDSIQAVSKKEIMKPLAFDGLELSPAIQLNAERTAYEKSARLELHPEKDLGDIATQKRVYTDLMTRLDLNVKALEEAHRAGLIYVNGKGELSFLGRDVDGRVVSMHGAAGSTHASKDAKTPKTMTIDGFSVLTEHGLRDRYPPVLEGDKSSRTVVVVKTAEEALAFRSLELLEEKKRSTIIVARDDAAFVHQHIKALMKTPNGEAVKTVRLDKADVNVIELNKHQQQAAREAAKEAAMEETKFQGPGMSF